MVESQTCQIQFMDGKPLGAGRVRASQQGRHASAVSSQKDQMRHRDHAHARIPVRCAEGGQLFYEHAVRAQIQSGFFNEFPVRGR